MGTTLTALNTGYSAVTFVAVIEGFPYVLTSGDPDATFAAFDGSTVSGLNDIDDAIGGLTVDWGGMSQIVDPWKPLQDAPTLRLVVAPGRGSQLYGDVTDIVGETIHKRQGGHETLMAAGASVDCNDLTLNGRHSSGFAASGVVYVGPEAMVYSSVTGGGAFTISKRGYCSPFQTASGARFARTHKATDPTATTGDPVGVTVPPMISDEPRNWIGKWVGVWILRNSGGTLDHVEEGHLAFAGVIASVGSDDAGRTVIELDHALTKMQDTVIHRDQYRATLVEGCNLTVGQQFGCTTQVITTASTVKNADALTVVSGTPASVNEIQAGRYTCQQIADAVNEWLRSEKAATNIDLHCQYTAFFSDASGGIRARWEYQDPAAGTTWNGAALIWPDDQVAEFMGWTDVSVSAGGAVASGTVSPRPPLRWVRQIGLTGAADIELTNPRGTWVSQNATLPASITGGSTTVDGVIKVDGIGYLSAAYTSDTAMSVSTTGGVYFDAAYPPAMITVESDATLEVTQVIVMEGTFKALLMRLIASTGTSTFNGTFDTLAEPLGCAIPYSILGADFEADLDALENSDKAACIIIEKPLRFGDLLAADFKLRWATLVWGQGRIQCKAWSTPLAGYATTTIGESSKAVPAGTRDKQRSSSIEDLSAIFNVVKFEYGADSGGELRDELTIVDLTSARDYGSRAITIAARNASQRGPSAESIGELIASFSGTMAMFSRPFFRIRRPMAVSHFEQLVPLTIVAYTDPHLRNPDTGLRGVTAWPAIVLGSSFDWGGVQTGIDGKPQIVPPSGEVTLMLRPRIVSGYYSPAVKVDDTAGSGGFSAGYSAALPGFKVYEDTFNDGATTKDASYFAANDYIRIIEIDPSVAASPTTWTAQIASVTSTEITLKAALGAPAWDAAKKYIIIPDTYSATQTSQRDKTFQADDADGLIENARNPFGLSVLGSSQDPSFTLHVATTLPSRPSTYAYGDGKPLDVAYEFQAAELANNMVSYKTAPICPEVYTDTRSHSGTGSKLLTDVAIVGIGEGRLPAPLTRKYYVAPRMRSTDGNTATIRVSLCKLWPQGDSLEDAIIPEPYASVTFTTASTTFEVPTAQGIDIRHLNLTPGGPFGGVGFLCVELVKGGSWNVEYEGLALSRLGPLVTP